jgi:4-hydroxy 2-oxovalerate aldolase
MALKLLDCTLRDGANVVGGGFDAETTSAVIGALVDAGVSAVEYGHPSGIGGNNGSLITAPLSDDQYLELAKPFLGRGTEIGMFARPRWATEDVLRKAARAGLDFVRVGCNAGKGKWTESTIKTARDLGMKVRYSVRKCYLLPPEELAEEALLLQKYGAQSITLMDSAGTLTPDQVREYVCTVSTALDIPTGFHGHNNLGMAMANTLTAIESGAREVDGCLMGMARSAGNTPTEVLVSVLQRRGLMKQVKFRSLLNFIDNSLSRRFPDYHPEVKPVDLILGLAGFHSDYVKRLRPVAEKYGVDLYDLILHVADKERAYPTDELIQSVAESMKNSQ